MASGALSSSIVNSIKIQDEFINKINMEHLTKLKKQIFKVLIKEYDDTVDFCTNIKPTTANKNKKVPTKTENQRLNQQLKRFNNRSFAEEMADHDNPHVNVSELQLISFYSLSFLQAVIQVLKKPREEKQSDLKLLEEEINQLKFFEDMEKKYLKDVCEKLEYEYYEPGEELVTMNKHSARNGQQNNRVFILLDGIVEFQVDLFDPFFQDKHLVTIAENASLNANKIIKECNDYRIQNEITPGQIMTRQINNIVHQKIMKLFTESQVTQKAKRGLVDSEQLSAAKGTFASTMNLQQL